MTHERRTDDIVEGLRDLRARGLSLNEALAEWRRHHPIERRPDTYAQLTADQCLEVINRIGAAELSPGQLRTLRHAVEELLIDAEDRT